MSESTGASVMIIITLCLAIIGLAVVATFALSLLGELAWKIAFRWGKARDVVMSVQLGWNVGEPPEGEWVLLRQGASGLSKPEWNQPVFMIVRRIGDRCFTARGSSIPVRSATGWVAISKKDLLA